MSTFLTGLILAILIILCVFGAGVFARALWEAFKAGWKLLS